MTETEDASELLFFDTFSHESDADINLDLVQFPKPVYITQVRIIPLGARVQADFPGGVRLGATNPSKFDIEFFVNDLGLPGASTFENLGQLQYNQNDCIHLECMQEKIPTDGLVLRGWYSTITLAVYGILTNALAENIASPPPAPLEPEEMDELSNVAAVEVAASRITDEDIKEEWKEPLPGVELAREHEDLDYDIIRAREAAERHYHREPAEDRVGGRIRKTSRSSDLSPTARMLGRSESDERDYLRARERDRDKTTRDWSRSPEYSRRARRKRSDRSRSELEDAHKWPRTPPASIDSPSRPRSPDYSDEDSNAHYKGIKPRIYRRSSDTLGVPSNTSETPEDPAGLEDDEVEDEGEAPGTPVEQFEPILSDDEMIGDDQDNDSTQLNDDQTAAEELELELQSLAVKSKPAIIEFDPYHDPLEKFDLDPQKCYAKDVEIFKALLKKYEIQTKCENAKAFRAAGKTTEEKEAFVYLSEQFINHLTYLSHSLKRRNYVVSEIMKDKSRLKQLFIILSIALDFDAACAQPQPAYKIRHIKTGARLMELLAPFGTLLEYLLKVQHFDPFKALLELYHQNYMALSIKLLLLKAIYALLDSKVGVKHFLSPELNGYKLILELLKQSKLTRTKYALQAIIKKLNLNEALLTIRECSTNLFVLANYEPISMEPYEMLESALLQLLDSLEENCLSYQQPKRFLPVSKKFEISSDAAAYRSFANCLHSFFVQNSLAESLLLIMSNASECPSTLVLSAMDVIQALLRTHVGLDYLVDDCFEVTQMMVAILLGSKDIPQIVVIDDESPTAEIETAITTVTLTGKMGLEPIDKISDDSNKSLIDLTASPIVEVTDNGSSTPTVSEQQTNTNIISKLSSHKENKPLSQQYKKLAIELALKVQTRYHIDAIIYYSNISEKYEPIPLATHLHLLYSQTCNPTGRQYTIELLGTNSQLEVFMDLIKKEQRLQAQRQLTSPGTKYKSPVLSYAVDMVDCCVRYSDTLEYLIEYGSRILEFSKNHETFEPSVSAVLQEMFVYLKPLETINIFAYDDITPLVEVITRSLEYVTTFPGDLIMGLRILHHLAIGPQSHAFKSADTEELKHRYVALQFYAADGMQTLIQIIDKLCNYFEQPGLHGPALMTIQGVYCCQIILPCLQIMRTMLSYAIQCRDVEFKDLTAIDHLMRCYYLMYYYPKESPAALEVEKCKQEIIQTLLAYTQPNEQDEELLHKSLWTQMIREILKNIDSPATFMPGLFVLTELLPLPLPVPVPQPNSTKTQSTSMENLICQAQRLITERKLWSAHLHPQGIQLSRLIDTIAPTTFPQLRDLFIKVCTQLADLAPNMTLLITKSLSDLLTQEWFVNNQQPTNHLARLLQFYARLNSYPSLKISTISILMGKLWDLFQSILHLKSSSEVVIKCQIAVHRILESFLDSEVSFIASSTVLDGMTAVKDKTSGTLNLASCLPPKELIPKIVEAIFINLSNVEITKEVSAMGVRNLVILTEHDITFYHLAMVLKQKSKEFQEWMCKIIDLNEQGPYNSNVESLLLLLRSLTQIEDVENQQYNVIPTRTLKLLPLELAYIIGLKRGDEKTDAIERIRVILERNKDEINPTLLSDIKQLKEYMNLLNSSEKLPESMEELETLTSSTPAEPNLPQTESIVTQYDARPVFTCYDPIKDTDKMCLSYWLKTINMDTLSLFDQNHETQSERISCDLTELARCCLPPECNLTSDCKRVLHLSASPQSNRERTPTAPCFRTRRVEVEPTTGGRPEKKIFISSMRGRGFRPPPSRGDLFRSRPPNTSRPPSLHVDDFLALETCGAQPTGPTGYNKIPPMMRGARVGRNRGSRISAVAAYRKAKLIRTGSPSPWNEGGSPHYRPTLSEAHLGGPPPGEPHYSTTHFTGRFRGRGSRPPRPYMR